MAWILRPPCGHRHAAALGPNAEQDAADLAAWVVSMGSEPPHKDGQDGVLSTAMPELSRARTRGRYDGIPLAA